MKLIQANKNWFIAFTAGVCLAGAAVGTAIVLGQRQSRTEIRGVSSVRELSTVFREITRDVMPSIVSITTRGKPVRIADVPFHDGGSDGGFFPNEPRFREFFKRIPRRQMPAPRGMGSGFVIDATGIIMTNSHVVRNAEEVLVTLHDGREFVATDVKHDPHSDVAIVRIDAPRDLRAIRLGSSKDMQIGDWVLAVGSPFRLHGTVTAGIISAKGRGPGIARREDFLQTDAAINPGNSGGPLINLDGEVIGINTAISTRSGGYDGIGFAIPVDMARWVSQQLIERGEVLRAYLGVTVQPVDGKLAKKFKTAAGQGAIVGQVLPDSPAAEAKLEPGDVILQIDGHQVRGPRNLQGLVEKLRIGKTYRVTILRNGKRMTMSISVRVMPKDAPALTDNLEDETPAPSKNSFQDLGLEIGEFTLEIAERLGIKNTKGVLITSVEIGSPAQRAGLRTGEVIEKVDTARVTSPDEFRKALKNASLQEGLLLLVRSPRRTRFLVIQSN